MKKAIILLSFTLAAIASTAQSDFTDSLYRDDRWYYCMTPKSVLPKYFYPKESYTEPIKKWFRDSYSDYVDSASCIHWWSGNDIVGDMNQLSISTNDTISFLPSKQDDYINTVTLPTYQSEPHLKTFILSWEYSTVGSAKSGKKTIKSMCYPTMQTILKYLPKSSTKIGSIIFTLYEQ